MRLRLDRRDHVWNYDFVMDTTNDGRPFRVPNVIDEYTRECLAIKVGRMLWHQRPADVGYNDQHDQKKHV